MSGSCHPTIHFNIVNANGLSSNLSILGTPGVAAQRVYWQDQLVGGGLLLQPLEPITVWLAINPAGYIFLGVGDPDSSGPFAPTIIVATPTPAAFDNGTTLELCTLYSDWTITSLVSQPLIEVCNEFTYATTAEMGNIITFQYAQSKYI